jgi:predicted transcriptional regulator
MKKSLSRPKRKTETAVAEKLVALTVKIDNEMYVRLSMLRARERKTAQEILTEALNAYLDRAEARK